MAKKKKDLDENQEEFQDNSGNEFGEDDDNFGLPEVEYEPLDRGDSDSKEEEQPVEEQPAEEKPVEEQPVAEEPVEEPKEEKPKPKRKPKTKKAVEPDFTFDDTSDDTDEPETSAEDFNLEYEEVNEKSSEPSEKDKKSMGPIIMTIVILIVVIGGVLGYIFYYAPMQEQKKYDTAIAEGDTAIKNSAWDEAISAYGGASELRPAESYPKEQITKANNAKKAAADKKKQDDEAAAKLAEEQRLAAEAEAAKGKSPEPGTVERLTESTGRYYVVIASSIDGDLAMDHALRVSKLGRGVQILSPIGNVQYHRVTLLSKDTYAEAQTEADNLQTEYNNAWVVKY